MSSLFAGLKEKIADKLAEYKGSTAPQDPNEKHVVELVEAATSGELIAPDWNLNLSVVDFINGDVHQNSGRALKAIKRCIAKPNTKVQLLSLTLLEACVKNCAVEFHAQLATSELWSDVVKIAEDTSITRVAVEVRDKVLGMVEDFSRYLQPKQFQATYEGLLDRGVDFPIRAPDDSVPFITPPASAAAAVAGPPAVNAATAAAGELPARNGPVGNAEAAAAAADPLAGLDEQDRAAIQAALADLEAEAEAERIAAEADAAEWRQQRQQHHQAMQLTQQQQAAAEAGAALGLLAAVQSVEAVAAAQGAAGAATATATATAIAGTTSGGAVAAVTTADGVSAGISVPQGVSLLHVQEPLQQQQHPPGDQASSGFDAVNTLSQRQQQQQQQQQPPSDGLQELNEAATERVANLLETANTTTMLLSEMLASVPDSEPLAVREPYVAEVADTCVRLRSRLERLLETLADEVLLASALNQHEELSRVLQRYDELLEAAEAVAPTVPRNAAAVALSHAAASRGLLAAAAGHAPGGQRQQQLSQSSDPPPPQQHGWGSATAAAEAGAGSAGVPAGQKVAAVAAALKERFAGAIDKLMAAAAATRASGAQLQGAAGPADAAGFGAASGLTVNDASIPLLGVGGAFTIVEDEEDEAEDGISLVTKRAPQPQMLAAGQAAPPLQQLLNTATAPVPAPPPPPPAPPVEAGPDLINFDDDVPSPPPPPQPAAASPTSLLSTQQQQQQEVTAGTETKGVTGGLDELLAGLTIHTQSAAVPDVAAASAQSPPPPPAASVSTTTTTTTAGGGGSDRRVSQGGPTGDQLVDALDLLVSQASAAASPEVGTPLARGP